jgi:hypothetical protein
VLKHVNMVSDGCGGLEPDVITDLSNGRREVSLALAGDDEFKDLAPHGGQHFSHHVPFKYEQLFVG